MNELAKKRKQVKDLSRELLHDKLATKSGERMLNFMLMLGDELVSMRDIRRGEHRLAGLYNNLTQKTFPLIPLRYISNFIILNLRLSWLYLIDIICVFMLFILVYGD